MFNKIKTVAYLQSTSLELLGDGVDTTEIAIFPDKIIQNLQVTEEKKLKQTIIDFLAKTGLKKQKILVVLGEGMLFEKVVPFTSKEEVKKQAEEFFSSVPFDKENIAKTTLTNDKDIYFIVTNKELYKIIAESFVGVGWKVDSIVPITLFGYSDKKLTKERVTEVLKNTSLLKLGNFLLENPVDFSVVEKLPEIQKKELEKEEEIDSKLFPKDTFLGENEKGGKKTLLVFFLLVVLFTAIFFLALRFRLFSIPFFSHLTPTPTATPVVTQTPSPTVKLIKKEDLRLQVQNGTGVAGQAKKAKDMLTSLGYKTIDTKNADALISTDTTVTCGQTVSPDVKDELKTTLSKSFKNVVLQSGSDQNYDIVIVTGTSL